MFDLFRDWKHTMRRLARTPGFALATVLTLALGIGANTAIFSVVNSVLLRPLPFPEPDRLVGTWQTAPGVNIKDLNPSLADYVTYREHSKTFQDVAIWNGRSVTVTEFTEPERVEGISATFRLLPMLGVHPILGRDFTEEDNRDGSPEVVMIGHAYWRKRFSGDPNVIGRRLMADGTARQIIGVLPKGFWLMDAAADVVMPVRFNRANVRLAGYNSQGIARLRPGVTLGQANADVKRMIAIELRGFPPPTGMNVKMMEEAGLAPNLRLLKDDLVGDLGNSLWVVMATIGMVLLIACANVANLLLVRAEGRSQELAVRAALGAGSGRLAREMFVESLTLALMGGAAGLGLAVGAVRLVTTVGGVRLPRLDQIAVDAEALAFTLLVSIMAGLAFGAIPVFKLGGARLAESLRAGGRNASAGRERNFVRNALTVVQVALALVLLIGSGLMIRTFQSMRSVEPGFRDPATVQTLRVSIPPVAAAREEDVRALQKLLADRLAALPGVTATGLTDGIPMTGFQSQDPIFAKDRTYAPNEIPKLRHFLRTTPGAFAAMGTPFVAGRDYTWTDVLEKRQVAIISANFAREYWGSAQAALGKQIREVPSEPWSEVIGVVGDIRHDGAEKAAPTAVYWPVRMNRSTSFLIRSSPGGRRSPDGGDPQDGVGREREPAAHRHADDERDL